jgi:hypothetical protein
METFRLHHFFLHFCSCQIYRISQNPKPKKAKTTFVTLESYTQTSSDFFYISDNKQSRAFLWGRRQSLLVGLQNSIYTTLLPKWSSFKALLITFTSYLPL